MSHMSDLSIGIDEAMAAVLSGHGAAHADIAATPGPRSVVHAELAHRYAILARRVRTGVIDWADEPAEAVTTR